MRRILLQRFQLLAFALLPLVLAWCADETGDPAGSDVPTDSVDDASGDTSAPAMLTCVACHTDEDMLNLALWLKANDFRADQVQAFLPSPMAMATAMWHSGRNPLKKIRRSSEKVFSARGLRQRRLHKAFLRYHDPANWPLLHEALVRMGRADLIGNGKHQLIPKEPPDEDRTYKAPRRKHTEAAHRRRTRGGKALTQHTGLPPRSKR